MNDDRYWNRCDYCGRFIGFKEFEDGARREMITPDSDWTCETWDTLCLKCIKKEYPETKTKA